MADLVDPKPLSGFQDVLPADALVFEEAVEKLKRVFRSYGYAPIDTPCIYRYATLTGGDAGIDKQLFDWRKPGGREGRSPSEQPTSGREGDGEGEHVALRFDLTVPMARYVAANLPKLTLPFKRYDVGKVWRGERPQKGRFREFYQCDFDVVGTTAASSDLEVALVMSDSLEALGAESFQVRLNDRQILNGVLEALGLLERSADVLRVVDKLDKVGVDGVREELVRAATEEKPGLGLAVDSADRIIGWVKKAEELLAPDLQKTAVFEYLEREYSSNARAKKGVERLRYIVEGARRLRGDDRFRVDLSIARGLGYYTGTIYECVLTSPGAGTGSVCSGGRYDDLASKYTKQRLPGVGASVGLSRFLDYTKKTASGPATPAPVLFVVAPDVDPREAMKIADELRRGGVGVEVYPQATPGGDEPVKMGKQFKYGDARGHSLVLVLGGNELAKRSVQLKNMKTTIQEEVPLEPAGSLLARVRQALEARA